MSSNNLKVGFYVTCPQGIGRIWEVYPKLNRCGVVLEGMNQPVFFSIDLIKPYLSAGKSNGNNPQLKEDEYVQS